MLLQVEHLATFLERVATATLTGATAPSPTLAVFLFYFLLLQVFNLILSFFILLLFLVFNWKLNSTKFFCQ